MRLLVGLGNPGLEYAKQRHNIGFMLLEQIAARYGFSNWRKRMQGLLSEGSLSGLLSRGHRHNEKLLALKPQTYMNRSGSSVGAMVRFFKLEPEQVLVFHDELDLPLGKVRIKQGGSTAGHRGLLSLDEHIGNRYWRVRLGIGHPGHRSMVQGYVLQNFTQDEQVQLERLCEACVVALPLLIEQRYSCFLNHLATDQPKAVPNLPAKLPEILSGQSIQARVSDKIKCPTSR